MSESRDFVNFKDSKMLANLGFAEPMGSEIAIFQFQFSLPK